MSRIHNFAAALALVLAACSSSPKMTGTTNNGTNGGNTGTNSNNTMFSGTYSPVSALYEGGANGLDPDTFVLNLLSAPMTCTQWQDPNAPISSQSYDLEVVLNGATGGAYSLLNANTAGQNSNNGTGVAVDAYFDNGETGVSSLSGSATVSSFTPGGNLEGSMNITWDDGETLSVPSFTATYCPDTNNWGGPFVPKAAYFEQDANTTAVLLISQPISCADWTNPQVAIPLGTTIWEVVIGGTTAGTYTITTPTAANANQALAFETYSNATVSSTTGSVTLSNVSATAVTVAVPNVGWSNNANSSVAAIPTSPCNF